MFFMFIIDQRVGKRGIAKLFPWLSGKERYLISKWANIWMAKKVVPYSRPVIDKLSIKLNETYILVFVKDVSTYIQTVMVKR